MTNNEVLTLIISALALAASIYAIWSNNKSRRADALQRVRDKVTTNAPRFDGVFDMCMESFNEHQMPPQGHLTEANKMYTEMRNVYDANKHHFKKPDRSKIDTALNNVIAEGRGDAQDALIAMRGAVKLIRETLEHET